MVTRGLDHTDKDLRHPTRQTIQTSRSVSERCSKSRMDKEKEMIISVIASRLFVAIRTIRTVAYPTNFPFIRFTPRN